jgi:hypothetical protein
MPSSIPDISGSECAALPPITLATTDWTTRSSSDFVSFVSGESIAAGRHLVSLIVRNSSESGSVWISGRSDLTTESPETVGGAIEVPYGEALTIGLYGSQASAIAYCGDVGSAISIIATFFPY